MKNSFLINIRRFLPLLGLGILLLLTSCGSKTERFAKKVNDKCPYEVSGGKISEVTFNGHEMIVSVTTDSKNYDFMSLNQHMEATRRIRAWQLALHGEKTMFGHLLRLGYEEGYELTLTYQDGKNKDKSHTNTVGFTPFQLQDIFDKESQKSTQMLSMLITIEYINMSLPRKIDEVTTQDNAFFSDGNVVMHLSIDTSSIDWNAVIKSQDNFKKELTDGLREECKASDGMRGILKQCLTSGYNYVYEFQSKQDASKSLRFTFTPQEIKQMLF